MGPEVPARHRNRCAGGGHVPPPANHRSFVAKSQEAGESNWLVFFIAIFSVNGIVGSGVVGAVAVSFSFHVPIFSFTFPPGEQSRCRVESRRPQYGVRPRSRSMQSHIQPRRQEDPPVAQFRVAVLVVRKAVVGGRITPSSRGSSEGCRNQKGHSSVTDRCPTGGTGNQGSRFYWKDRMLVMRTSFVWPHTFRQIAKTRG